MLPSPAGTTGASAGSAPSPAVAKGPPRPPGGKGPPGPPGGKAPPRPAGSAGPAPAAAPGAAAPRAGAASLAERLAAAQLRGAAAQRDEARLANPQRLWLTFETRFNWPNFAKSARSFEMRLFETEMQNVLLVLASEEDGLDGETLRNLARTFFPEHADDLPQLREFGRAPWDGKRKPQAALPSPLLDASGDQLQVHVARRRAVLPYNLRDNTGDSRAIGTRTSWSFPEEDPLPHYEPFEVTLAGLAATLQAWSTASRSSIAEIGVSPGSTRVPPSQTYTWPRVAPHANPEPLRALDASGNPPFRHGPDAGYTKRFASLKSGVDLVGFERQGDRIAKDKLEHNSLLAAQRSAFIRFVERDKRYPGYPDPTTDRHLAILTEVLTATIAHPNWDDWLAWKQQGTDPRRLGYAAGGVPQPAFGDGFQVRSLRGMRHDREYFPPTSIPFVRVRSGAIDGSHECRMTWSPRLAGVKNLPTDDEMPRVEGIFSQVDDAAWRRFWRRHYAEALGRTKSQLLLRYGLQGFGGNAQNFLVETDAGRPTGRIVVRDMGDYALHDYVLWALYGPGTLPPSRRGVDDQASLVATWQHALGHVKPLRFECMLHAWKNPDKTGQPGLRSEFPTFVGYHRHQDTGMGTFNPFCRHCYQQDGLEGANFVGHVSPLWAYAMPVTPQRIAFLHSDADRGRWARVMAVQTEWGIAHAKAWVEHLELALGHSFGFTWRARPASVLKACPTCAGSWSKTPHPCCATILHEPADYLRDSSPGYWNDLYTKFKFWEIALGWQVEQFLATKEGQQGIRRYVSRLAEVETRADTAVAQRQAGEDAGGA